MEIARAVSIHAGEEPQETLLGFFDDALELLEKIFVPELGITILYSGDAEKTEENAVLKIGDETIYGCAFAARYDPNDKRIRNLTDEQKESAIRLFGNGAL